MEHSFLQDEEKMISQIILKHGNVGKLVKVEKNQYAFLNKVWKIFTTAGIFILKRNNGFISQQRLEWVYIFLRILHDEKKYRCDKIILSLDGCPYILFNSGTYTIHSYLPGQTKSPKTEVIGKKYISTSIEWLSIFHINSKQIYDNLAPPPDMHSNLKFFDGVPNPSPLLYHDDIDFLFSYLIKDNELITNYERVFLEGILNELSVFFDSKNYNALDYCIIHGDYRIKNIIFNEDDFVGVFDWDFIQEAPRLIDVCGRILQYYLEQALRINSIEPIISYFSLYNSSLKKFGYRLSTDEKESMYNCIQIGIIRIALIVAIYIRKVPLMERETTQERANESKTRFISAFEQLKYINKNRDELYYKIAEL
jgi:hypothetical protein